jgi:hypothetical protein
MRQSLYIKLATFFIRAELQRESREWKSRVRRASFDTPWDNQYLLKDIGLEFDGRAIGVSESGKLNTERKVRHLKRMVRSRLIT